MGHWLKLAHAETAERETVSCEYIYYKGTPEYKKRRNYED